jgi:polyisoprenoid-binding protein YceI
MKTFVYLFIGLFISQVHAQDLFELNPTKSTVLIEGTSSLHDWEMQAKEVSGRFEINSDDQLENLRFNSTVTGLVSDKSKMTKLAHKALKSKEYSDITFISNRIVNSTDEEIKVSGILNISGISKEVELTLKRKTTENGIKLEGSYELKMTDYGIDPPKALLGAIKTANEITVTFSLVFES